MHVQPVYRNQHCIFTLVIQSDIEFLRHILRHLYCDVVSGKT